MAIVYHALNRNYEGSQSFEGDRDHVEHYEIMFDEPPTSEVDCYTDRRSPRFGDVHVDDKETFVSNLEATSVDGVKFDLAVTYSRTLLKDRKKNPLANPAVITARSQQRNVATTLDANGDLVLNTADDLLGARDVQRSFIVLSVTKNLKPHPWPGWLLTLRDVVNQSAIKIKGRTWPKHTLRLDNITIPEEDEENDIRFLAVTFDLTYKSEGWRTILLNQGFYEIEEFFDANKALDTIVKFRRKEILDGEPLKPLKEPVFLDKDGKTYRHDDADKTLRTKLKKKEIIKLEVMDYREVPFNILPLK